MLWLCTEVKLGVKGASVEERAVRHGTRPERREGWFMGHNLARTMDQAELIHNGNNNLRDEVINGSISGGAIGFTMLNLLARTTIKYIAYF